MSLSLEIITHRFQWRLLHISDRFSSIFGLGIWLSGYRTEHLLAERVAVEVLS